MIYFFTPYSFGKRLFEAFDEYMSLVNNSEDWVCFTDGDTAFLRSDFGHKIQEYIEKYPETGLFTSYASRCHYSFQVPPGAEPENPSILFHKTIAEKMNNDLQLQTEEINCRIAGHLMIIKKKTWLRIRMKVRIRCETKNILGVDTKISNEILNCGLKIRLMKGIYIFHYLRLAEGYDYKKHLMP
jgi:GT2 family glycosyltransferase